MAWFEGLVANRADDPRAWPAPGREPIHRQWHSLAAAYRRAVARHAREIRQMELDLPAVPVLGRPPGLGGWFRSPPPHPVGQPPPPPQPHHPTSPPPSVLIPPP